MRSKNQEARAQAYQIATSFFRRLGRREDSLELARETWRQFDRLRKETGFNAARSYKKSLVGHKDWPLDFK